LERKDKVWKENINRRKLIAKYSCGKVLDIGFGWLSNPYLINPVGLDIEKRDKPSNYESVFTYDGNRFPFEDNYFDTVTAGELIEHINNVGNFLTECNRVLRTGGELIISTPNPYYISEIIYNLFPFKKELNKDHITLFSRRTLKRTLDFNGFKLVKIMNNKTTIPVIGLWLNVYLSTLMTNHYIYICEKEKK